MDDVCNKYVTKKIRDKQQRIKYLIIISIAFCIGLVLILSPMFLDYFDKYNSKNIKTLDYSDLKQEYIYHFNESK